ncbi:MAG TPA: hypothetical protein VFL14_14470 [Xanthomonadales bacterium]|nr:hypothetical protein [Xanthomonadales bacterium]
MLRSISLVFLAAAAVASGPAAAQCDDISAIPVRYDVDFETEIQPLIGGVSGSSVTPYCENCHVLSSSGGMNMAPANIRLSWLGADETGRESLNFPDWKRIVPGKPAASLVYQRIHCDDSPPGRMPPGHPGGAMDPAFLQMQALVHDWIALGAIMDDTDRRFVGDFETIR